MTRTRGWLVVLGLVVMAIAALGAITVSRTSGATSIPTAVVQRTSFVDYLQLRGEIRPVKSVVLTAPSSGTDLQILQLAANGSQVTAGDVVVQFDATLQERTLEQKRSELKQAEAEIDRVVSEGRRRVQAVESELAQAQSAAARARLDLVKIDLVAKVESERLALVLANAELQAKGLQQKLAGERQATAADAAIVRQKRDKAQFDVADTGRVIGSLTLRAPAGGTLSLLPNMRAGGPMSRSAPEFRRGDRVWFGAAIAELPDLSSVQMSCRLDEADRARVQPNARVLVRVDALPDRELPAVVREIAMVAKPDFSSFPPVRNFDATVALNESDPRIRSGMSASARIELGRLDDVLVVPGTAIFQANGVSVAYVATGSTPVAREVTVLKRGRDLVAIASGLNEGERITLRDPTLERSR